MAGLLEEPARSNIREKIEVRNMANKTTNVNVNAVRCLRCGGWTVPNRFLKEPAVPENCTGQPREGYCRAFSVSSVEALFEHLASLGKSVKNP